MQYERGWEMMKSVSLTDLDVLTRTVIGEARGETPLGQECVAWVIRNRWMTKYRGKTTITNVCKDRHQFSCWNPNDPNRSFIDSLLPGDDLYLTTLRRVAGVLLAGSEEDPTHGSRHYHVKRVKPVWSSGKVPVVIVGNHQFFNNVA